MLKKILNIFNNDEALFLNQTDYETKYKLIVESVFKMGAENNPFNLQNTTYLALKQTILRSSITTTVTILDSKTKQIIIYLNKVYLRLRYLEKLYRPWRLNVIRREFIAEYKISN